MQQGKRIGNKILALEGEMRHFFYDPLWSVPSDKKLMTVLSSSFAYRNVVPDPKVDRSNMHFQILPRDYDLAGFSTAKPCVSVHLVQSLDQPV